MPMIEVMTPRGIEMVHDFDFEENWHVVQKGFLLLTCYDRKPNKYDGRNGNGYQPIGSGGEGLPPRGR
ncbi:hypothetical protein D3C85_281180 [compost metagenome]